MQLAYILPDTFSAHVISALQSEVNKLSSEQQVYVAHLLKSRRRFKLHDVWKAVKRAKEQRP